MKRKREPDCWLPNCKKNEIRREVKSQKRDSVTVARKIRRRLYRNIRRGEFDSMGLDLPKPGKFVATSWRSSGAFKSAYRFARSEAEFYDMAQYANY